MRLEKIFAEVLDVPAHTISDDASQDNLGEWTSLRNVTLLVTIEQQYGIRFSTAEMTTMRSVGDIRSALARKGVAVG